VVDDVAIRPERIAYILPFPHIRKSILDSRVVSDSFFHFVLLSSYSSLSVSLLSPPSPAPRSPLFPADISYRKLVATEWMESEGARAHDRWLGLGRTR
jgi:hypothetical protein